MAGMITLVALGAGGAAGAAWLTGARAQARRRDED
jgi:hypothetical protein